MKLRGALFVLLVIILYPLSSLLLHICYSSNQFAFRSHILHSLYFIQYQRSPWIRSCSSFRLQLITSLSNLGCRSKMALTWFFDWLVGLLGTRDKEI
ncbi:hypothetical protein VIGAN_08277800 [Vigna angularis var. angularis]|uniref:Uncharacterized protein n=1 Tax=Vigna angularis var. angularis TaxID=157739 RepID=A0A0S3SSX6_PHAAN|nr:hypothetical protein VIGAN_08277800 [Vigna angularis var. angularis]